jgi:hypothetical protein
VLVGAIGGGYFTFWARGAEADDVMREDDFSFGHVK